MYTGTSVQIEVVFELATFPPLCVTLPPCLTSPISGNGKSDDVILRSVVAFDVVRFESETLRFDLTQIDQETRVDDNDAVAAFVLAFPDRLVLVRSPVIVIQAHAAPIIRIQTQRVQHGCHHRIIGVDHGFQCLIVGQ